ncbi:hypothetical protein D3C87_1480810 [compost metagenome]
MVENRTSDLIAERQAAKRLQGVEIDLVTGKIDRKIGGLAVRAPFQLPLQRGIANGKLEIVETLVQRRQRDVGGKTGGIELADRRIDRTGKPVCQPGWLVGGNEQIAVESGTIQQRQGTFGFQLRPAGQRCHGVNHLPAAAIRAHVQPDVTNGRVVGNQRR